MRVFYYALGGGHGHAMRGLALLERLGHGTLVLPERLAAWAALRGVDSLVVAEAALNWWSDALTAADLLLVDVFPRGVAGELVPPFPSAPRWLIARFVRPDAYLREPARSAIESLYERLVWCETPAPELQSLAIAQDTIGPAILDPSRLSRAEARSALGVSWSERLVLAVGAGPPEVQGRVRRLVAKVASRLGARSLFTSHELPEASDTLRLFPASRFFLAADALVGAGGYHFVHEAAASGVPAVFLPQRRPLDDQFHRVASLRVAHTPLELEKALASAMERGAGATSAPSGTQTLARMVRDRVALGAAPAVRAPERTR